MYKCHICGEESKALNVLFSSHYKKHKDIDPQAFKDGILEANGRPVGFCRICGERTFIPKGECEYPKYHKQCYLKRMIEKPENNPNYRGGKGTFTCCGCGKVYQKYKTQVNGIKPFCSSSCSTAFYSREENITEAGRRARAERSEKTKEALNRPEVRERVAKGQAAAFKNGCSKLEINIFNKIKELLPTATNSEHIGFYVVDILIDKIVVEVQGDYWHNLPGAEAKDRRKRTYLTNRGYTVVYIWEHEWHGAADKEALIKSKLS